MCDKRRINQHKVFKDLAQRGQCSLGWFYGFKLHIITNDCGGIIDFMITKGNVDDRKPLRFKAFIKNCSVNSLVIKVIFLKIYLQNSSLMVCILLPNLERI